MRGLFRGSLLQRPERGSTPGDRGLPKCGACKFYKDCISPKLEPGGRETSGVMLVGEHPGEDEDRQGEHFCGSHGQMMREALSSVGQRIHDCHLTHAMACKPSYDYTPKNVDACRPLLLKRIDELKPKVIIALGPAATRSLIQVEREKSVGVHDRWVGFAIPSKQLNAWICPTWSPQQVHRFGVNPVANKLWRGHLERAFSLVGKVPKAYSREELWGKVEVVQDQRTARKLLAKLANKQGLLAIDYETNCRRPELSRARLHAFSFCLNGVETYSILLSEDRTIRALSPVLRNSRLRKVGSNIAFEERWTRCKLGHGVRGWERDTMLAAHYLDNRGKISSIKFQAFVRLGVPDYDKFVTPFFKEGPDGYNRIHELDELDLLSYNALDSLVEYMVSEEQWKEMGLK